jgi:hypothetical protein
LAFVGWSPLLLPSFLLLVLLFLWYRGWYRGWSRGRGRRGRGSGVHAISPILPEGLERPVGVC